MTETELLKMELLKLICAIDANVRAYDDDLESTLEEVFLLKKSVDEKFSEWKKLNE